MTPRRRAPAGPAPDRGAATLEGVGVVVVAAVLAAALLVTAATVSPGLASTVRYWVCQVTTLGQGGCQAPTTASDRVPTEPCVVRGDGRQHEVSLGVAVMGSADETWMVEQLGDGTYRLTRGLGLGASLGVGPSAGGSFEVDGQEYGLRAGAGASVEAFADGGEVYVVPDEDTAYDYLGRTRNDDVQDVLLGEGSLGRQGWDWLAERTGVGESGLPEPDEVYVAGGVGGQLEASATSVSTSAEAGAVAQAVLGTRRRADGTSTVYYEASVSAEASAGVDGVLDDSSASASAGADAGSAWEVDYDRDGSVTAVRISGEVSVSATSGSTDADGDLSTRGTPVPAFRRTTLELPTRTTADRAVAADMAAAAGVPYVPGLSDEARAPGLADPLGAVDAATTFATSVLDHGRAWEERYTSADTTAVAAQAEVGLLGEYGGGFESVESARTSQGVSYYDGRGWTEMEGCTT